MKYVRAFMELGFISGLLFLAIATFPLWMIYSAVKMRQHQREAAAGLKDYQAGRGGHYDTSGGVK